MKKRKLIGKIFGIALMFVMIAIALPATSPPAVVAQPPLSLWCSVTPNPTKIGHVTNFTAGASGGVGNYTWLWTVNGTEVSENQNTTYNFNTGNHTAGIYVVCINVTDSSDNWEQCCMNVTVNPPLSLECNVSPNPTNVGHETDFTAAASGGIPPYYWLWTIDGTAVATTQNTTHIFATAGNYNVCVNVTDSLGNRMGCCGNVTVNPPLSLECNVSPTTIKVGNEIDCMAGASGGVGNYTWLWTVNGTKVSEEQNTTYNFTTGNHTAGLYEVCVNVTDSLGNERPCCTNITVNPALSLVLSPKTDVNLVGTFHVITATVYDQFNNVTEGVNLTWSISGVGNFSGTPGDITNGEGQAYTEITSSVAGTSTVRCEVTGDTSVFDIAIKIWTIVPIIPATIEFDPDTLGLKNKGQKVILYIELPMGYNVAQIDISSVMLNGMVPALDKPTKVGDYDSDGVPDMMVKFNKAAIQDAITVGEEVEVTITGEVAGIGFEGSDTINLIITAAPPGLREWDRVSTPSEEGCVLAPDSTIIDYAVADGGEVAYAIVYSDDTGEFHLLKSTDGAATWDKEITDALVDELKEDFPGGVISYYLWRIACDPEESDFVAVTLQVKGEVHVYISRDGSATFKDTGEVEDGVSFPSGWHVTDMAVSTEDDDEHEIAVVGSNGTAALIFRCTAVGDFTTGWKDARYDGWDNQWLGNLDTINSMVVTDVKFAPSWIVDKTILVTTINGTDPYDAAGWYSIYLQTGTWGTTEGWNEQSIVSIPAVLINPNPVHIPVCLATVYRTMQDYRGIAGLTLPLDYAGRYSNKRYAWVWVNHYDVLGNPTGTIFKVKDDDASPVGPMGQIEDGEVWLTNVDYLGYISEGKAIAGVLGTGGYAYSTGCPGYYDDIFTECCEGVQVYRNDGIVNMDICCEPWEEACKPPTGTKAMAAFYASDDPATSKAYAVALWGYNIDYDEGAWSVSFDDGDVWNQLSLIDTYIDYLSDVAVSADCNKTMLVSINVDDTGEWCGCDSVWQHAENLPEAEEYSGKWLRTWCGMLGLDDSPEWGFLRLAPEETTGDTVYLVDYYTDIVYWNELETLGCWEDGTATADHIVDLAVKDKETIYALDMGGTVAMSDDYALGWYTAVDSELEEGYTIAVWGDDILVGGCDGDVSHSADGGETFTELEDVAASGHVTVVFDSYFDQNNTIYAALANAGDGNGIYRWVIHESTEWENLDAEDYDYTGLVLCRVSRGKLKTSANAGGILYASYVSGDTTGVARCLKPAEDVCCDGTDWDYLTEGLTSELFVMTPQALKICGCLTAHSDSKLFAIDGSDSYDMEEGRTGTVWSFED